VTVGELRLPAALFDSAAAADLVARLPVTVTMSDQGGVEKIGRLLAAVDVGPAGRR